MAEKKRAARGSGSIRQRKDGRWEARFVVGYDPGTGKELRRSLYAHTQREARRKMTEALAALDRGDYRDPCRLTVGQWLDTWAAEYLGGVKPLTVQSYSDIIRLHIKPAFGAVRLEALAPHQIQAFYNRLRDDKGLSPKTIKNTHGVLHKALGQAVVNGYIRANPADACTLPRMEPRQIKPLDEVETRAFLQAIEGHEYEYLYSVVLFTGLRRGEVLGLMWDCVDFERGVILVDKQLQRANSRDYFAPLKNDKARTITPAPWVMELLRQQQRRQQAQRRTAGDCWEDTGLVFTDALGGCLSSDVVYRRFKALAAQIGRPDARFHDLRHSYAVASIRAGDDIKTVQENLGHATAAFTLNIYGHVTEQMRRASAARMETYITDILGCKGSGPG